MSTFNENLIKRETNFLMLITDLIVNTSTKLISKNDLESLKRENLVNLTFLVEDVKGGHKKVRVGDIDLGVSGGKFLRSKSDIVDSSNSWLFSFNTMASEVATTLITLAEISEGNNYEWIPKPQPNVMPEVENAVMFLKYNNNFDYILEIQTSFETTEYPDLARTLTKVPCLVNVDRLQNKKLLGFNTTGQQEFSIRIHEEFTTWGQVLPLFMKVCMQYLGQTTFKFGNKLWDAISEGIADEGQFLCHKDGRCFCSMPEKTQENIDKFRDELGNELGKQDVVDNAIAVAEITDDSDNNLDRSNYEHPMMIDYDATSNETLEELEEE